MNNQILIYVSVVLLLLYLLWSLYHKPINLKQIEMSDISGNWQIGGGDQSVMWLVPDSQLKDEYHVIASGQCNFYQDWQMAVLWWSLRKNWKEAKFSRLLNCADKARKDYKYKSIMPTIWADDYATHPKTKDGYAPYNKPVGVIEFMKDQTIKEKWIVIIDPDQIVKKPMDNLNPVLGRPVAQEVGFAMTDLDKVVNFFGFKIDQVDKVSVPIIIHQNDLRRIAPLWLLYTELIRQVPRMHKVAGWIAEMYGYMLAAAKLGIRHTLRKDLGDRIPYSVKDSYSLHYDLAHESKDKKIKWDKRSYMKDDVLKGSGLPMPVFSSENSPTLDFASVTTTINQALQDVRRENKLV